MKLEAFTLVRNSTRRSKSTLKNFKREKRKPKQDKKLAGLTDDELKLADEVSDEEFWSRYGTKD